MPDVIRYPCFDFALRATLSTRVRPERSEAKSKDLDSGFRRNDGQLHIMVNCASHPR